MTLSERCMPGGTMCAAVHHRPYGSPARSSRTAPHLWCCTTWTSSRSHRQFEPAPGPASCLCRRAQGLSSTGRLPLGHATEERATLLAWPIDFGFWTALLLNGGRIQGREVIRPVSKLTVLIIAPTPCLVPAAHSAGVKTTCIHLLEE